MTTENVSYLHELARELLGACVTALNDDGLTPPDRRYVHPGSTFDVARDCSQLVVSCDGLAPGLPGAPAEAIPIAHGVVWTATFGVQIVTCVNTLDSGGRAPSDDEIDADALVTYQQVWSIHQGILEQIGAGTLFAQCQRAWIPTVEPVGPEGGLAGWVVNVEVQLEES